MGNVVPLRHQPGGATDERLAEVAATLSIDPQAAIVLYRLGYLDGAMDMAKTEHAVIDTAMRQILKGV